MPKRDENSTNNYDHIGERSYERLASIDVNKRYHEYSKERMKTLESYNGKFDIQHKKEDKPEQQVSEVDKNLNIDKQPTANFGKENKFNEGTYKSY